MRPQPPTPLSAVSQVCLWIAAAAALLLLLRKRYQVRLAKTQQSQPGPERRSRQPLDKLMPELRHRVPLGQTVNPYAPGPGRCLGGLLTPEQAGVLVLRVLLGRKGLVLAWETHPAVQETPVLPHPAVRADN